MARFGVPATREAGTRVIPLTLLAVFLLKLIPDGKKASSAPDLSRDNAGCQETLKELVGLPAAGKPTPVLDRTYSLGEFSEAMRHLNAGHARGKVVITLGERIECTGLMDPPG